MKPANPGVNLERRRILAGLAAAPAMWSFAASGVAKAETAPQSELEAKAAIVRRELKGAAGTKLVLLGTGAGPLPGQSRHMASNVIVHNHASYIVDCGMGVTDNFARTGIPFSSVKSIFITHQHPDHNIEYGPFLVLGWVNGITGRVNGLNPAVVGYGPPPLTQMTQDYLKSMAATIHFWAEDFEMEPLRSITTHDLAEAGHVMQDENVKVRSVLVKHPPVTPAYGYRFDFPDRSIVFSGDTVPLDAVAELAKGADVLVHEAMILPAIEAQFGGNGARDKTLYKIVMRHMVADHSPVEDVGRIAAKAGVKTLVLAHLTGPGVTDEQWRAGAAKYFKGEIIVGHDLMVV